jgi:hypothetical protein
MYLRLDKDNPLTDSDADNEGELHLQADDVITIIAPDGGELVVYVNDDGNLVAD